MTTEQLNSRLYARMQEEQRQFHDCLITQPPDVILRNAYQYAVRDTIVAVLECNDLPERQCRALLSLQNPLEAIYAQWEKEEPRLVDQIMDAATERANAKIREDFIHSRRDAR